MAEDSIGIGTEGIKRGFKKTVGFFKSKKVQTILTIILLFSIIVVGVSIRTQNLPLLVDKTTGEHIPLALDPFYFLRVTETIAEQGGLPEFDEMRFHVTEKTGWTKEIWPYYTNPLHKIVKVFNPGASLQFTAIIFPVIFFVLGIIAFFFLVLMLTKSKTAAISSSAFLTVLPPYLYRSTAGFYDHEINGMFFFFIALIGLVFALRFLDKIKSSGKKNIYKSISFGLLLGILTILTMVNWGGISNFLFMIIPLSFGIFWLLKTKNLEENKRKTRSYLAFYLMFSISTIIFGLIFGFGFSAIMGKAFLNSSSLLNSLILIFIISDFATINYGNRIPQFKEKIENNRILFSVVLTIVLGLVALTVFKGNPFQIIWEIVERILRPFGADRVGLTVAENRQPFLNDWISQTGKIFYWLFIGGLVTIGAQISGHINQNKNKYLFLFFWIFLLGGILYSRISPDSLLDGVNFISKLFYFGSVLLFTIFCIKLYKDPKENLKISPELLIIFSWMIFMLIGTRGAIRLFFVITPFTCLAAGILISNTGKYFKKISKKKGEEEGSLGKIIISILFAVVLVASVMSLSNLTAISTAQASQTGPSADGQWQQAMSWVRENTQEDVVFAHWWDYGYWVQYLGERKTLVDGGYHPTSRVHMIGRYVLTSQNPDASLSFMKTNQITHFLVDSSDLGKYPAYSKIGSDENWDRFSSVSAMPLDSRQTQTSDERTLRVYPGGLGVEDDIVYTNENGEQIFLPGASFDRLGNPSYRTFFGGAIIETTDSAGAINLEQPAGVFIYNNQRYDLPLRKIYFNGEIIDFGSGIDSTLMIIPSISQSQGNLQINNLGAVIYLNPRVQDSLFAQLYLMNDPENRYPEINLAHSQYDPVMSSLRAQGINMGDFVYFQGFRGPIKVWEINYPENIRENEEFLKRGGGFGEFDDLEFTKELKDI